VKPVSVDSGDGHAVASGVDRKQQPGGRVQNSAGMPRWNCRWDGLSGRRQRG
jgi:hypothetical protein